MNLKQPQNYKFKLLAVRLVIGLLWIPSSSMALDKASVIESLKDLKKKYLSQLEKTDQSIKDLISTGTETIFIYSQNNSKDRINKIESLRASRKEQVLRVSFLDRLIFIVDSKYEGSELRQFFQNQLSEMAKVDLLSNNENQNMWRQSSSLSLTLKEISELDKNIVSFIGNYLDKSPFNNPIEPKKYLQSHNYSDGTNKTVAASPIDRSTVGQAVESRLRKIEEKKSKN